MTSRSLFAVLMAGALVLAACGDSDSDDATDASTSVVETTAAGSTLSGSVLVSGSSTVEPISVRAKELFNDNVSSDVEITVNGPGTSAGFKEFCPGDTDINDASRAIKDSEAAECVPFVELRVAFDGIAVMVHPNNPLECVEFADLYAISGPESVGNTWGDAEALAASLGSGTTGWPSGDVAVIAPGTESGTYGSYIEIVLEGLAEERAESGDNTAVDGAGDPMLIRDDYAGLPDDNVILEGIASTENAFGWVGFAFAEAAGDSVKILEVKNEAGECVAPSLETIADGSYPVSRSLYIYVNTDKAAANPALVAYVDYYLGDGYVESVANAFAEGVGYVTLPADLKAETDAAWAAAKGGAATEVAAPEPEVEEVALTGSVLVSGSSTVEPISVRAKELFNDNVSSDVEITVNGPGTSAGFKEFCPGDTDINDASRAIKDSEAAECVPFVELRVAFDGIAVMVHPNNPLECVEFADLYAISGPESVGNTWGDAEALAASLGSGTTGWPSGDVAVIAPGTESGTYGSYIEIVLEGLAEERAESGDNTAVDGAGDPMLIRDDYAGLPDDNVILEGIASTENAFGWVGFAFAEAAGDSVKILEVKNEAGECVAPSLETIADGSYPVSRSLYIYVNTDKAAANPALVAYVDYYLGDGYVESVANAFAEGVGYVTLPADLKAETDAAWAAAKG